MRRLSKGSDHTATSTPPHSFSRKAGGGIGSGLNGPAALNQEELDSVRKFSSELRGKSLDDLKSSKIIDREAIQQHKNHFGDFLDKFWVISGPILDPF